MTRKEKITQDIKQDFKDGYPELSIINRLVMTYSITKENARNHLDNYKWEVHNG